MNLAQGSDPDGAGATAPWLPGRASQDRRIIRARIAQQRVEARIRGRIAARRVAAQERRKDAEAKRKARDLARQDRAARWAAAATWCQAHTTDLLFLPVIAVPGALSWTGMASFGLAEFGPVGLTLPALSEGGMWAFAAATTRTRRTHPGRPVWHLRLGTLIAAAYATTLNFLHGLTANGPLTGISMALISVSGVTVHQLITAGPRRSRADREQARLDKEIARRERTARRVCVRNARIRIDDSGHAHLVIDPGTATLSRSLLRRARLEFPDRSPALNAAPVQAPDPVRTPNPVQGPGVLNSEPVHDRDVRAPEPACSPDPVHPTRTENDSGLPTFPRADPRDLDGDDDRRDPPVDRNAVVAALADQIRDAIRTGDRWKPDYGVLMAATGRKRRWCEKVVHDARITVLEVPARTDNDDRTDDVRTDETRTNDRHTDDTRTGDAIRRGTTPDAPRTLPAAMPGAA